MAPSLKLLGEILAENTCILDEVVLLISLMNMMSMSKLSLLSVLLIAHCSTAASDLPKDVFILAGQSNMAGRGGVSSGKWSGDVPPECKPDPSIFRLNAKLSWEVAHEPLHSDIDVGKTCGVGPGMAFANEVRLRANESKIGVVGLVPCAVGGTKISDWEKGTRLYSELLRRAHVSVSGGGVIRAILWYQGESDTVKKEDAQAYQGKMKKFIMDLRSDLNNPSLLFVQV